MRPESSGSLAGAVSIVPINGHERSSPLDDSFPDKIERCKPSACQHDTWVIRIILFSSGLFMSNRQSLQFPLVGHYLCPEENSNRCMGVREMLTSPPYGGSQNCPHARRVIIQNVSFEGNKTCPIKFTMEPHPDQSRLLPDLAATARVAEVLVKL